VAKNREAIVPARRGTETSTIIKKLFEKRKCNEGLQIIAVAHEQREIVMKTRSIHITYFDTGMLRDVIKSGILVQTEP